MVVVSFRKTLYGKKRALRHEKGLILRPETKTVTKIKAKK
jgi:hypothetical protein